MLYFNKYDFKIIALTCLVFAMMLMSSCKSTKFLKEDESLVKKVEIIVNDSLYKVDKPAMIAELNYFVRQQKNKKLIGIPREYIFFKQSDPGDTSSINNWVRKTIGEQPSIYSKNKTNESAKAMEQYLKYKKGYYNAKVDNFTEIKNQKAHVTYKVNLGSRYIINSIEYNSKDANIYNEIKKIEKGSYLIKGDGLDGDKYEKEKARIVNILQNKGYADFAGNYVVINGDSTIGNYHVDVIIEVLSPIGKINHPIYKVGEVKVFTDHYHKQDTTDMYWEMHNGIKYLTEQSTFIVDPKIIGESISFKRDSVTKRDDRINTYNKLSNLGAYRFAEIVPRKNKVDTTIIDYDIQLTPYDKKWIPDSGLDIFNSTINTTSDPSKAKLNLLGFGLNSQISNRNFLGGSEKFTADAAANTQLELSNKSQLVRVLTLSLNSSIQYPTFKDPLRIVRFLNKFYLASDNLYRSFEKNATTSVSGGASSVNFRNQYSINSINAVIGYKFTDNISRNILLDQVGVSYSIYGLNAAFLKVHQNNQYLINSFQDNILTGFVFRNINYNYSSPRNENGISKSLFTSFEMSGLEISALNGIANMFSGNNKEWALDSIEFSKYIRFEIDGRLTKHFSGKKSLVGRLNLGIINPWKKNQSSPYVKQFNVGGPNSLRAWAPRALGPGSAPQLVLTGNNVPFSQGDLKIEANMEYRFNIWWILDGALFLDAGNVWALSGNAKPEEKFNASFTKQIAVAAGWGMRWDFNYFNIRFDFGYRVRDPYPTNNKYWYSPGKIASQNLGNIQVAVNYPF